MKNYYPKSCHFKNAVQVEFSNVKIVYETVNSVFIITVRGFRYLHQCDLLMSIYVEHDRLKAQVIKIITIRSFAVEFVGHFRNECKTLVFS